MLKQLALKKHEAVNVLTTFTDQTTFEFCKGELLATLFISLGSDEMDELTVGMRRDIIEKTKYCISVIKAIDTLFPAHSAQAKIVIV